MICIRCEKDLPELSFYYSKYKGKRVQPCLSCKTIYHREWRKKNKAAIKRYEENRKKKQLKQPTKKNPNRLPVGPLKEYLTELTQDTNAEKLAAQIGIDGGVIRRIVQGKENGYEKKEVDLGTVDRILTGLGDVHMLHELYPLEE